VTPDRSILVDLLHNPGSTEKQISHRVRDFSPHQVRIPPALSGAVIMIREAGILRKLPDEDDLYLTIDGTLAVMYGEGIPRMLAGQEKPLYVNRKRAGSICVHPRPGHEDLIIVNLHNLEYTIWRDKLVSVWNGRLKYAYIHERIPDCWAGFGQEVTA